VIRKVRLFSSKTQFEVEPVSDMTGNVANWHRDDKWKDADTPFKVHAVIVVKRQGRDVNSKLVKIVYVSAKTCHP
jgi:hypothetical protein